MGVIFKVQTLKTTLLKEKKYKRKERFLPHCTVSIVMLLSEYPNTVQIEAELPCYSPLKTPLFPPPSPLNLSNKMQHFLPGNVQTEKTFST